jgi:mono/diheme cytochrome c family protein
MQKKGSDMKNQERRSHLSIFVGSALAAVLLNALPTCADDPPRILANKAVHGFRIAPVPLDLQGKNRALVGLGSYIVNAQGACNDCHTAPPYAPGGSPFNGEPEQINTANYLAGGTAFGPFVSRNLTPDATGKPAGLTVDQFLQVMRTGQSPNVPGRLLQVMPWPVYGKMTDRDLRAVYEYLRAIPHAEPPPAP